MALSLEHMEASPFRVGRRSQYKGVIPGMAKPQKQTQLRRGFSRKAGEFHFIR